MRRSASVWSGTPALLLPLGCSVSLFCSWPVRFRSGAGGIRGNPPPGVGLIGHSSLRPQDHRTPGCFPGRPAVQLCAGLGHPVHGPGRHKRDRTQRWQRVHPELAIPSAGITATTALAHNQALGLGLLPGPRAAGRGRGAAPPPAPISGPRETPFRRTRVMAPLGRCTGLTQRDHPKTRHPRASPPFWPHIRAWPVAMDVAPNQLFGAQGGGGCGGTGGGPSASAMEMDSPAGELGEIGGARNVDEAGWQRRGR
jgi:hypothetical protein